MEFKNLLLSMNLRTVIIFFMLVRIKQLFIEKDPNAEAEL